MPSESKAQRAKELGENAHGNIKSKRLLKIGTADGAINANYLSERPFIDYLDNGEQPHYFFCNESKGVATGDSRVKAGWFTNYRGGMWVTDCGVHFTVGKDSGDFHEFVPFSSINNFEVSSGILKNKFAFQTDHGEYRFLTKPDQDTEPAKQYISNQLSSSSTSQPASSSSSTSQPASSSSSTSQPASSSSWARVSDKEKLSKLQQMDEAEFEQVVADLWEEQGWNAKVTQDSYDRGVDVVADKEDPFEQRQLIQAKRYGDGNKVGSSEIQKYSGLHARDESVDAVVVITTSSFTSEAERVAANRDVKTIDGERLCNLIQKYDAEDIVKEYVDTDTVEGCFNGDFEDSEENWAENIDKLQADNTEEDTVYDVLSRTKKKESSWPQNLIPVSDSVEIRNTLMRCLNEAFDEKAQGIIKWNGIEFEYAVVVVFSRKEGGPTVDRSGVDISIEIAKKEPIGGGIDLEISSVSSLSEQFDYQLEAHTEGDFSSVIASRFVFEDEFSILDEISTIEYIIEDITDQSLQDINQVSVVDPEQF